MSEKSKPLILSVDDDQDNLDLMQIIFSSTPYDWIGINRSPEAYAQLRNNKIEPDLIILDLDMPEMNGLELCQKLQELPQCELVPILFLTAHRAAESRLIAFQSGAVGYLQKPMDAENLLKTVAKYIDIRKQWESAFVAEAPPAPSPPNAQMVAADTSAPLVKPVQEPASGQQTGLTIKSGFQGFISFLTEKTRQSPPKGIKPEHLYDYAAYFKLTDSELAELLSQFLSFPFLTEINENDLALDLLPLAFCRSNQVIPLKNKNKVQFVTPFPFAPQLQELLDRFPKARRIIAAPEVIETAFRGKSTQASKSHSHQRAQLSASKSSSTKTPDHNVYQSKQDYGDLMDEIVERSNYLDPQDEEQESDTEATPLVRLVNQLISEAYLMKASDIHIEPWEQEVVVRYRIDGELKEITRLQPQQLILALTSRLKIMASLDISERRLPQDGRIVFKDFNQQGLDFDLRLATAPMNFGEKIVMRILDKQKSTLPLPDLGLSERNLALYRQKIRTPYGMVLHVGPTGSGKSMTLYSALNEINRPEVNIQTAEDPIEYTLPGIHQLQVKPAIGLTFARALRAYLRQDPDIILVGEIRDKETAEIALEAALTGHLLLSTLHTNDAASTLVRFMEMGMEPYLIATSIVMICAQRLMRRLCPHCKTKQAASVEQKALLYLPADYPLMLYQAVGCEHCHQIGYLGRIGVHELLAPAEQLRHALNEGANSETLKRIAVEEGMTTLFWDGFDKVLAGFSSLEELLTRVKPDEFDCRPKWWFDLFKIEL